jgi:hypothetical protein
MKLVLEINGDQRDEFVRELDAVNDRLLEAVADEDPQAIMGTMAYGIAGLCRLAAEILRPTPSEPPQDDDRQLRLFDAPDGG